MKIALMSLILLAFAEQKVGETVPETCWKDFEDKQVCLSQSADKVRVLMFNAGWCPACNEKMGELVQKVDVFKNSPVVFYSLSSEGYKRGAPADAEFLKNWKEKHKIPFIVAASPRDPGRKFFEPPLYIPNVVIVGRDGKLTWKEMGPEIDDLLDAVREALK